MGFRIESYRRGLAYSSALSVVDNVLAFVPSMLIAAFFGTSSITDVYYYATGVLAILVSFFSNFSPAVIIPEYMRLRIQKQPRDAFRFMNMILLLNGALTLALVGWAARHPVKAFLTLSRFNAATLEEHRAILYWVLPLLPLQTIVALFNDTLHSHKFFTVPMLSSITNRLVVIVGLLLGHRHFGLVSVLSALQLSFVVQGAVLMWLLRKRLNWEWTVSFVGLSSGVLRNLGYAAVGGLFSVASSYVPIFLFSGLAAGVVTGLQLAQRLTAVPFMFLGAQAAAVMGIKLNELFALHDQSQIRSSFSRAVTVFGFLMGLVSATGFVFGRDIIAALYQRGAFDDYSTQITAALFRRLCWVLPFLMINAFLARIFMAAQRVRDALWCQALSNFAQIILVYWAVNRWGGLAYPPALCLFYVMYLAAMVPIMAKWFPFLQYGRAIGRMGIILLFFVVVACLAAWMVDRLASTVNIGLRLGLGIPVLWGISVWINRWAPFCPDVNTFIDAGMNELRSWKARVTGETGYGV